MEICRVNILANASHRPVRSNFLFGFGFQLANCGLLLLAFYYIDVQLFPGRGQAVLEWIVPTAQGTCLLAAILLAAGLSRRGQDDEDPPGKNEDRQFQKLPPFKGQPPNRGVYAAVPLEVFSEELKTVSTLLGKLDWEVLRDLSVTYFAELGFRVTGQSGHSRGVDFFLYTQDDYRAIAVRCVPCETDSVNLRQVRKYHRTMMLAGAIQGVMIAAGTFDEEAMAFGEKKELEMVNGEDFAGRLLALPKEASGRLLAAVRNR